MERRDLIPSTTNALLIDGLNLAFKAAYTLSRLKSGDRFTGVIYGMLNSILSCLQKFLPEAAFIVWEGKNNKARRRAIYSEYKEGRKSDLDIESLFQQVDVVEDLLYLLGVGNIREDSYEADDSMATFVSFPVRTVMVSSDKDLIQLVRPSISQYITGVGRHITSENLREQLEISFPVERYVDYKVLVGDSADNIQGVAGIGKKTANDLLAQYSLDEYMVSDGGFPRTANLFTPEGRNIVERNRQLMDLSWNQTEERRQELLKNIVIPEPDMDEALEMLEEYEMWSLLDRGAELESMFNLLSCSTLVNRLKTEMEENGTGSV